MYQFHCYLKTPHFPCWCVSAPCALFFLWSRWNSALQTIFNNCYVNSWYTTLLCTCQLKCAKWHTVCVVQIAHLLLTATFGLTEIKMWLFKGILCDFFILTLEQIIVLNNYCTCNKPIFPKFSGTCVKWDTNNN